MISSSFCWLGVCTLYLTLLTCWMIPALSRFFLFVCVCVFFFYTLLLPWLLYMHAHHHHLVGHRHCVPGGLPFTAVCNWDWQKNHLQPLKHCGTDSTVLTIRDVCCQWGELLDSVSDFQKPLIYVVCTVIGQWTARTEWCKGSTAGWHF